jgi:4-aminobutyrate aminotransferase-like enzyme
VKASQTLNLLREYESRNVTFIDSDGSWPIVWEKAKGVHVWDEHGRKYLDLTAAFGVAAAGHANPHVVRAGQKQMATLLHAMGDVHPHALKARLARELGRITFERWQKNPSAADTQPPTPFRRSSPVTRQSSLRAKTIFCNSGFEAVEAALKTAMLATAKPGVVAFESGYHGLGYGALSATHRDHFRSAFRSQLREFGHFLPFPIAGESSSCSALEFQLKRLLGREKIGAVLVEPVQVRGGMNIPPPEFLPLLRDLCTEHGVLLILDEIYTGFGRTGAWFACEHNAVVPDVICLGKALTGGFPLSACVGRADLMDTAWPASTGEAIHTSTFLGHPVGCAMALAQIQEIRVRRLVERSAELGKFLLSALSSLARSRSHLILTARGLGLLAGLELRLADGTAATEISLRILKTMLRRQFILLPEGEHANILSFTPPLTISRIQLQKAVDTLKEALGQL